MPFVETKYFPEWQNMNMPNKYIIYLETMKTSLEKDAIDPGL